MNRRQFVKTAAITLAGAGATRLSWAADGKLDRVGLQLYTVRESMKKDIDATLAQVSQAGFTEVEFAGYFDRPAKELRALIDKHGLGAPSAHTDYKNLGDKFPQILDYCHALGHKYIVCPAIDEKILKQPDGWKQAAETFNRAGEEAHKAGVQLAYHNHVSEFAPLDGRPAYDYLLEQTDPKLMQLEMDLCWITVAGQDPKRYFDRWPGRIVMVHIKDIHKIPDHLRLETDLKVVEPEMTTIGTGMIDWKKILRLCADGGVKHYFVENDAPQHADEFLRGSYQYLHEVRF